MKVAIVCDWFIEGGAEKVVVELHAMYPQAPIYTSYCSPKSRQRLGRAKVVTGYLQRWPFSKLRKFLPPLRAWWFSRLDLSGYDLVISVSGAEAKFVRVKPTSTHVCYCLAPTHYYWSRYEDYLNNPGFGLLNPLARLGLKLLVTPMRHWDYRAAQRPNFMIGISTHIQKEINKYYRRDAQVIHPPVEVEKFKPVMSLPRRGFLIAGRQTPYKRFDLAVAACAKLELSLHVIGDGPEHKNLMEAADSSVSFLGWVNDEERVEYFQRAEAFIFPGVDDFGIVAVEALAAGTPVIAYAKGGALDYISKRTGVLFHQQTVESLAAALQKFNPSDYSQSELVAIAKDFSPAVFRKKLTGLINEVLR